MENKLPPSDDSEIATSAAVVTWAIAYFAGTGRWFSAVIAGWGVTDPWTNWAVTIALSALTIGPAVFATVQLLRRYF